MISVLKGLSPGKHFKVFTKKNAHKKLKIIAFVDAVLRVPRTPTSSAAPLGVGTDSDNDNATDNNCDNNDRDSDAANREYATRTETETPLKRGKRLRKPGGGSENRFFAPLFARLLRLCSAYLLHGYICRRFSFVGRLWPWVFNVCNATAAISTLPLRRLLSVPGHCLCLVRRRRQCRGWLPSFFGCRKFLMLLVENSEATQDYHEVRQRTVYKFRQMQSRQNAALSAVAVAAGGGAGAGVNASFRGCCFFRFSVIVFVFCFTP